MHSVIKRIHSEDLMYSWLSGKSTCNAGDSGLILGSERSPGERNGNPLQYSCLGNPKDRGAWWLQAMGSQELDTT